MSAYQNCWHTDGDVYKTVTVKDVSFQQCGSYQHASLLVFNTCRLTLPTKQMSSHTTDPAVYVEPSSSSSRNVITSKYESYTFTLHYYPRTTATHQTVRSSPALQESTRSSIKTTQMERGIVPTASRWTCSCILTSW